MSLTLSVCFFPHLSVCPLTMHPAARPFVYLSIYILVSVCSSASLVSWLIDFSIYSSVCVVVYLSFYLSAHISIYVFISFFSAVGRISPADGVMLNSAHTTPKNLVQNPWPCARRKIRRLGGVQTEEIRETDGRLPSRDHPNPDLKRTHTLFVWGHSVRLSILWNVPTM